MGSSTLANCGSSAEVVALGSVLQQPPSQVVQSQSNPACNGASTPVVVEKFDVCAVRASCSFSRLYSVIQGLDEEKRGLVRQTGFGGLLGFPAIKQLERRFVMWLMSRVDALSPAIIISEDVKIHFSKEDVHRVFGIPCAGKKVAENGRPGRSTICEILCYCLGIHSVKNRSIKVMQEMVEKDYGGFTTEKDRNAFKVSFVIYVMSTMLSPGAHYDHASIDYWDALLVPDQIDAYDWSEYVLQRLLDSIVKAKIDLEAKSRTPNISGCSLFLQVLYLDSIELGRLTSPHVVFPRISCFSGERIGSMILADTSLITGHPKYRVFGKNMLRKPDGLCYTWAKPDSNSPSDGVESVKHRLWEAIEKIADLMEVPIQRAEHLFHALVRLDASTASMVASAITDYATSFRRTGSGLRGGLGECSSGGEGKRIVGQNSSNDVAVYATVGLGKKQKTVEGSRLGYYDVQCIDGVFSSVADINGTSRTIDPTGVNYPSCDIVDPWVLGFSFNYSFQVALRRLTELCLSENVSAVKCPCIAHRKPRYIEVKPAQLGHQMVGEIDLEQDTFDAVVRRFNQRDDIMYGPSVKMRWRHILESDFMDAVVAGITDENKSGLVERFFGRHVRYDVSRCKLMFFPFCIQHRWVCYVWLLDSNQFWVLDPHRTSCIDEHAGLCHCITDALVLLTGELFKSSMDTESFEFVKLFEFTDLTVRNNRSGVACLYFCAMFDGQSIRGPGENDIDRAAYCIIAEALDLEY